MSIPHFPSQDLAKLVLGYLAEEQLMTAYDEFLQASPYLDAFKNEYDRMFMTSLRNILAEYRALKIYVETCKPIALRRRLLGCTNLLEVLNFLLQNIDVNKLQAQDTSIDRTSTTLRPTHVSQTTVCEFCHSLNLHSCVCKNRPDGIAQSVHPSSLAKTTLDTSIETTALEDLPGNHGNIRKKHVKVLEKNSKVSFSSSSCEQDDEQDSGDQHSAANLASIGQHLQCSTPKTGDNFASHSFPVKAADPVEAKRNVEEFNGLKTTPNVVGGRTDGTLPGCATDVVGKNNGIINVPDSSTTDTSNVIVPVTNTNLKPVTRAHILLKVESVRSNALSQMNNDAVNLEKPCSNTVFRHAGILQPKLPNEQKVTILSDVKVDKIFKANTEGNQLKMPQVLKNATSTPLMHMQTIVINGTPAYKQMPKVGNMHSYTEEEIMAMPTLFLVETGPPNMPALKKSKVERTPQNINPSKSAISSTSQSLEPLLIDVSTINSPLPDNKNKAMDGACSLNLQNEMKSNDILEKTVEMRNASVPKCSAEISNKSTPHAAPPSRKSSSTPRRNSHVRVLNFTNTPRRILQDTKEEDVTDNNTPSDTIITGSPGLNTFVGTGSVANINNNTEFRKEISPKNKVAHHTTNKYNWDADLRALAVANQKDDNVKPKPRTSKKTKSTISENKCNVGEKLEDKKLKPRRRSTTKDKNVKNNLQAVDVIKEPVGTDIAVTGPVKPTINIITGSDWGTNTQGDSEKIDDVNNKSNNDDPVHTPEMDRILLQNAIGAKLNISELLETPYKQALYDIQMETPRFLGPDLPDAPMSDIKIMNIPTPRFFNSPKPTQATPSSYSSRPTDYSSGGSYYKPDDQDYVIPIDLEYPEVSDKVTPKSSSVNPPTVNDSDSKHKPVRSSRPVRKCTKNVSYYNSPIINKNMDNEDDTAKVASSCRDTTGAISLCESKIESEVRSSDSKSSKNHKCKTLNKSEIKKKFSTPKIRKTPVKKDIAKFMKIKPRRPTPTKHAVSKKRKSPESQARKRTSSKEKNITPLVICVPTKSRRKSSTPRKLQCNKAFHSESSGHESPEMNTNKKKEISIHSCPQDSNTDQLRLRWSDDGSHDAKLREKPNPSNESDDITKIQEYIATSEGSKTKTTEKESDLHIDLVSRGFDVETAKSIERDLLDTPPFPPGSMENNNLRKETLLIATVNADVDKTLAKLPDTNSTELEEGEEDDEIVLSVNDCNENSKNYITCEYDDTNEKNKSLLTPLPTLKDKYSMEICIDGIAIRLRATPFSILFDQDPQDLEIERAVSSITNIDKLYTPMKDSIKAQCYEIFDSTLTSLDTPLKVNSPKRKEHEMTVTEIVLEVEKVEVKEKLDVKKRKRPQSGNSSDDSTTENKRTKPEPQYLLNSTNIQNIDIETVLYKLHGP